MEFTPGKFYKTKARWKAQCLCQITTLKGERRWVFYWADCDYLWSDTDGQSTPNSDYHIIGEWQEPVVVKAYWFGFDHIGEWTWRVFKERHDAEKHRDYHAGCGRRVGPIEEITTVVP